MTPNSPIVCANASMAPVRMPRFASGKAKRKKISIGEAPKVRAASRVGSRIVSNAFRIGCTTNGSE